MGSPEGSLRLESYPILGPCCGKPMSLSRSGQTIYGSLPVDMVSVSPGHQYRIQVSSNAQDPRSAPYLVVNRPTFSVGQVNAASSTFRPTACFKIYFIQG